MEDQKSVTVGGDSWGALWAKAREVANKPPPAQDLSADGWMNTADTAKSLGLSGTGFRTRRERLVKSGILERRRIGSFIYFRPKA